MGQNSPGHPASPQTTGLGQSKTRRLRVDVTRAIVENGSMYTGTNAMRKTRVVAVGGAVLLLLALGLFVARPAWTPPIRDEHGDVRSGSVATLESVHIGGMEQWILVRGKDISNPVLLWLHGGPGAPQIPLARHFNGALEDEFVVVHWDQRGAGKSNPRDFDQQTMSMEQFIDDTHELTLFLKERFDKDKIYLLGHSWGSQLGIKVVQEYPEDYHAYVAVGQVVTPHIGQEIGRAWLLEQIQQEGNENDLERLRALGAPPYNDHEQYVAYARMIDAYGGDFDVSMGHLLWVALRAPEYRASDVLAALQGMNRGSGPMWAEPAYQSFNAIEDMPRLNVPVYFFNGRHDYITPLAATRQYFDQLEAPEGKELVIFEESAHTPFMAEPEAFNQALFEVKQAVADERSGLFNGEN